MQYPITRSRRKTISISISSNGDVKVRAPLKASKGAIQSFVQSKQSWIAKHVHKHQSQANELKPYLDALSVAEQEKDEIRGRINMRLDHWAHIMNESYSKMRLSSAKTRWGSCSSNGTISLNWKLGILDQELLDYVVMHELSHRKHMNHSPLFWKQVEIFCPNYRTLRKQLQQFGGLLTV